MRLTSFLGFSALSSPHHGQQQQNKKQKKKPHVPPELRAYFGFVALDSGSSEETLGWRFEFVCVQSCITVIALLLLGPSVVIGTDGPILTMSAIIVGSG